jgi:hypothetical protein
MAIVAAVTIAYTALVGRPIFSKPSPPVEVNLVAPATIRQSPSLPTVIHDAAQLD